MKNEIGRNNFCPCMSGKKYKKCCMDNQMVKWFKENLNAQYIDGNYMLKNLMENSDLLNVYLSNKIPTLKNPIIWLLDENLKANMRSIKIEDIHAIIVKQIPVQAKDYFDIAHEIGHLVFAEQGYPSVNIKDNDRNKMYLATILANTVMDPKVNKEVISYGFDFIDYINKAINIQIPMINNYPNEINLRLFDKYFLKCLLIEKILEWDFFNDGTENIFQKVYEQKYPTIYKESLENIKFIRELGTDTPEKVRIILQKILDENRMNEYLEIV